MTAEEIKDPRSIARVASELLKAETADDWIELFHSLPLESQIIAAAHVVCDPRLAAPVAKHMQFLEWVVEYSHLY